MTTPLPPRKKLIEVALPLEAINRESAREKSIRHGHPSTLHLWWARRPLAACRAVLFSSLVDDPSSDPRYRNPDGTVDEEQAAAKRAQLFNLIEELVKWENSNNPRVIDAARAEIARCVASRKIETGELLKETVVWLLPEARDVKGQRTADLSLGQPHPKGAVPREPGVLTAYEITLGGGIARPASPDAVNAFLAEHAPPVLDPFCGGGSIPLEAQRLGLRAFGSDLNPVPVLITKALIEIPPKFADMPPVNPESRGVAGTNAPVTKGKKKETQGQLGTQSWKGAAGLAEDVRYYGRWMRDEAQKRIGHLYPKITVTEAMARDRKDLKDYIGQQLTVIAWLWARTIKCPNPACGARTPMVRSFWLATKKGKAAFANPVLDPVRKTASFEIQFSGQPPKHTSDRTGARCLFCERFVKKSELRSVASADGVEPVPFAVVCEGSGERVYLTALEGSWPAIDAPDVAFLDQPMTNDKRWFSPPLYGMPNFADLFTPRQTIALTTFCDLVAEARARVLADARNAGLAFDGAGSDGAVTPPTVVGNAPNSSVESPTASFDDSTRARTGAIKAVGRSTGGADRPRTIVEGSSGAESCPSKASSKAERYADAVVTYLAEATSKLATAHNTLAYWRAKENKSSSGMGRQAIPMSWDFTEINPFAGAGADFGDIACDAAPTVLRSLPAGAQAVVLQRDACIREPLFDGAVVCTDPPYYDNIGYADLSDYFYVWLRRSLVTVYPELFRTVLTPKAEELIVSVHRHGGDSERASAFFESGMQRAFARLRATANADIPLTVFYAFKQAEDNDDAEDEQASTSRSSTGWETMLEGIVGAGFSITGTWPMRTELTNALKAGVNALASSIVIVCRPRSESAPMASRREFVTALKRELPAALRDLQSGNIAPVDLAQAAIGPGMAVYSRYSRVLETSGDRMGVRGALALINQVLDEVLAEQEGEYDADTRWCIKWFEQYAHNDGPYGDAETLCKAMAVGVNGLQETGVVAAKSGKVRLFKRTELMGGKPETWDPAKDKDILHWEVCQYLCWALEAGGEPAAAELLRRINAVYAGATEVARDLAYRLYTVCERKKWAQEAIAYNSLVVAWPEIQKLAAKGGPVSASEGGLFGG